MPEAEVAVAPQRATCTNPMLLYGQARGMFGMNRIGLLATEFMGNWLISVASGTMGWDREAVQDRQCLSDGHV